jgi:uncharacterized protein
MLESSLSNIISQEIVLNILHNYSLSLYGIHGISHWARVWESGTRIAEESGANVQVVQLFALFHDSQRRNEGFDSGHGRRGAKLAELYRESLLRHISDEEFDLLYTACVYHTDGLTDGDLTVQACWDADRLDLNRVGILPEPQRLCTETAKSPEILEWANARARKKVFPAFAELWLLDG